MKKIILFFVIIFVGVLSTNAALPLTPKGCAQLQTRMERKNVPTKIPGLYTSFKIVETEFSKKNKLPHPLYQGECYLNGVKQVRVGFTDEMNITGTNTVTTLEFYGTNVYVMVDGTKVMVGTTLSTLQNLKSLKPNYNNHIFFYDTFNIYVTNGKVSSIVVGLFPMK